MRFLSILCLLFSIAACTPEDDQATRHPDTEPADSVGTSNQPPQEIPSTSIDWTVHDEGSGPLRFGMPAEEARTALSVHLAEDDPEADCYFMRPDDAPEGVSFMVVDGRIAQVNVSREATVSTKEGARLGDTEQLIRDRYGSSVQVEPHKYVEGGHYLVVPREADSTLIVFETDGTHVTAYRAGLLPSVEWVEGCY